MGTIRVGTRGSNLALWQATFVRETLEKHHPGIRFEQVIIKTEGDLDQKSSLSQIGGQGIFTKEIEKALLNNTIDIAVHSLKDLPSKMPEALILGAVPERGYVEDVLITEDGMTLEQLPQNAKVATFGAQAEDVFHVPNHDNQPLTEAEQKALREQLIERLDSDA
mgnify:CR=1 FL=1